MPTSTPIEAQRSMGSYEKNIQLPVDKLADFCRRWKVAEFALFGSVLRDDFRPDSEESV